MIALELFSGDNAAALLALSIAVAAITLVAIGFAAAAVLVRFVGERRSTRQVRLWKLWLPPVLDALADPEESSFPHRIRRDDRLSFLEMLARLAVSLSRDERHRLADIARPHIGAALELLRDDDPEFRALGLQLLGLLGPEDHRNLLLRSMQDPAPLVSLAAIRALARSNGQDDVDLVLEELPRFEKWGPSLLSTLLASFGERARPVLRDVLANASRPDRQRVAAAAALTKLNDVHSSPLAEQVLRRTPKRELAAACLRLLKRLGLPGQAGLVSNLAASDDPVVRLHAVGALETVGGQDDVDLLSMALSDPSHWVAMRASQALKEMHRLDRLQLLAEMEHPRSALAREMLGENGPDA